jgi:hypothetical protein
LSGGTFGLSGTVTGGAVTATGKTFYIPPGAMTLGLPVAS